MTTTTMTHEIQMPTTLGWITIAMADSEARAEVIAKALALAAGKPWDAYRVNQIIDVTFG